MKTKSLLFAAFVGLSSAMTSGASAQQIIADGSSTVYPITVEAARRAGIEIDVNFSGTTAGFRRFCAGETDISNASRPINTEEMEVCAEAGVDYVELPIAFDALAVVVNATNDWAKSITIEELRKLWEPAAEGTVTTWQQVREEWPDRPIKLFGRGQDSGTYDYFTTAIVGETRSSRSDYTASEDEEQLAAGIAVNPDALGFFGVGAYFRHWEEMNDLAIDAGSGPVLPAMREVLAGRYQPLARPLFLYVNVASLESKADLQEFLKSYLGGAQKWIHFTGYMPLSAQAYDRALERLESKTTGTRFDGEMPIGIGIDGLYN
ncbi:PstS family phosphate ABC transporter substrate-binding protein [Chelativorans sp. YIM 93263]|uniref:PstS family phosphate ABC transporter substrate-binding protein n=1 Tax=Chelativorans sp. YIM 93263 TaxID=2906648 RepID=UPI002379F134|nr:PstS family phosphate ABC transporter substrate-binding protein [Chelativorans sp. YIM 93263]